MDERDERAALAVLVTCLAWGIALLGAHPAVAEHFESAWLSHQFATRTRSDDEQDLTGASSGAPLDLNQLSDEELVELYVATYERSLRLQVADHAALVEPGRFLVQTGYTFSQYRQYPLRRTTHTLPSLLIRYRVLPRWELRAAWAGVVWDGLTDEVSGVSDWETRLSDPAVGVRVLLWSQRGSRPRTTLTISSPLNVDSNVSWVNRFDPFVGLGYSWAVGDRWLLSGTSAAVWTREGDDRYLDFQQSVSVDWLIGDRWGAYVEWSGLFPAGTRLDGMRHALGPGVSYSFSRDIQVDLIALFGLDDASPDILTQVLCSWRF